MEKFPINAYCKREGKEEGLTPCADVDWFWMWAICLIAEHCCLMFLFYLLLAKIACHKSWHCILWQRYCKGLANSSGWRSCQSSYSEQSGSVMWQWKLKLVWHHLCFDTLQVSIRGLLLLCYFVWTFFKDLRVWQSIDVTYTNDIK